MNLAPNLEIFFKDLPFSERLERIAAMGFRAADLFGIENKQPDEIGRVCERLDITISMLVGCNLQKAFNDRSLHGELVKNVEAVAAAAQKMHAVNVVVLSGNRLLKVPASAQNQAIIDGLKRLAPIAEKYEVTILLEMLNSLYDHPNYYLDSTELMVSLIRTVNHPRIKGLYDVYHAGIMGGNIVEDIRSGIDAIGHFHIAGIPGRHEPKNGELNYPFICNAIDKAGFKGYIGLEYWPLKSREESLRETLALLQGS